MWESNPTTGLLILDEYKRGGEILSSQFPAIDLWPIIELVTAKAEIQQSRSQPAARYQRHFNAVRPYPFPRKVRHVKL